MTTQTSEATIDKIIIKPQSDHVNQWSALKTLYRSRRGSDAGRNKAIPRTTNRDVEQLVNYWHMEFRRVAMRGFPALDSSKSSRAKWVAAKGKVDVQLAGADPAAVFPDNGWFWDATGKLAIYLNSLKVVPSRTEIAFDAVAETLAEHAETIKDAAKKAAEAPGDLIDKLKTGALIVGGALGLIIVIPAIARAFRD